jgi:hypothetical protein
VSTRPDTDLPDTGHLVKAVAEGRVRLDWLGGGRSEWSVDGEVPSTMDRALLDCLWTKHVVIEAERDERGYPMVLARDLEEAPRGV